MTRGDDASGRDTIGVETVAFGIDGFRLANP